jgi:anthranilate synthase component 1
MFTPTLEEFRQKATQGNLIPVYREILADRLTPVSAFERLQAGGQAFLLESVAGGERLARYSFLGADPFLVFRSKGDQVTIQREGVTETQTLAQGQDPLNLLEDLLGQYRFVPTEGLPRFCGGAVGYMAYDVVRFFERLPDANPDDLNLDDCCFLFTDTLVIFDHVRHRMLVLCNARVGDNPAAAYAAACEKIDRIIARLNDPRPVSACNVMPGSTATANMPRERYEDIVRACKEYIVAGDAFQVVPSVRFSQPLNVPPWEVYRALRFLNPSPYMYYLELGSEQVVGASPEILVTVEDGLATVRPIAGTRKRGANQEEDNRLGEELLADEKERAEHIMLVDLGRNDLGRISEYGSVRVGDLMVIERYSHVMHIVSNVTGRVSEENSVFDVIRASFPAGTLSGAPKVRAMEIIDEQEPTRRGLYGGAVGYFSYSGDADFAIAIRTMLSKDGQAHVQAGAGIVADSDPATEYEECCSKARAVLAAIELARQGLA